MNIKQIPCNHRNYSSTKRSSSDIKYIVIHYVGAEGGSVANGNYYKNNKVSASAHYYVGHKGEPYVQSVQDNYVAWSVGTAGYYSQKHKYCRNSNSISIELCCWYKNNNVWTVDNETVEKALELTEYLMKKYNIPKENVIRHYDVVNKRCPAFWVDDNRWKKEFWNKINSNKDSDTEATKPSNKSKISATPSSTWIKSLQTALNKLGYKDSKGKVLTVDGLAGNSTLTACPTIKLGDKNAIVKLLQERLSVLGYNCNGIDGDYGSGTKKAVLKFKADFMTETNNSDIGQKTWSVLLGIKK